MQPTIRASAYCDPYRQAFHQDLSTGAVWQTEARQAGAVSLRGQRPCQRPTLIPGPD